MKKWYIVLMIVAIFILMAGVSFAEDNSTANADYEYPCINYHGILDHTHQYQAPDKVQDPLGIGADVKVYKFSELNPLDSVNIEGKYDIQNNGYSVYAVLHLDLTTLYQDKK